MWKTSRGASAGALLKTRRCIPTSTQLASSVGTYLYGRRMYETMVYWETAHTVPNQPQFVLEWARQWQAAEKIVYSRTLAEPRSVRTRIEREFDPDVVRRLKADVRHDIAVDGPEIAAHALRAGLVDELQMIVCPVVVGAGKRFFPDRVRRKLELVNERRVRHGVVVLRYAVRGWSIWRHDEIEFIFLIP
jgi:dihydrofolate reductase